MKRVLATDKVSDNLKAIFSEKNIDFTINTDYSPEELKKVLLDYDGLIIRSKTKVTKEILDALDNNRLKVIGRAGIGVDNIDIPAATEKGIVVMNTPLGNTITTGEHAIAMLLSTARQIPYAHLTTQEGKWEKSKIKGVELTGKTLGLIGCGNIGSIVCNRAQGLKLKVIVYDPFLTKVRAEQLGVEVVDWDFLLSEADFISIHTPLTEKTKNLINQETISKMKDGVRIINCARGGIVNEDDLIANLQNGKVSSAALDVFQEEPLSADSPLRGIPNLILTPHLGASTIEAQERVSFEIAQQICRYLDDGTITNGYNVSSLTAKENERLLPYKKIINQLAHFIAQIRESAYKKITIEYSGEVASLPTESLLREGLQKLMEGVVDEVNVINSVSLAKKRGLIVEEKKNQTSSLYNSLISLKVVTEKKEFSLTATLLGKEPHIIGINGLDIEINLLPNNLYLENKDEPGVIKELATMLYEEKINIASFNLARKEKGGKAICIITLDNKPTEKLLEKIKSLPLVETSQFVAFE